MAVSTSLDDSRIRCIKNNARKTYRKSLFRLHINCDRLGVLAAAFPRSKRLIWQYTRYKKEEIGMILLFRDEITESSPYVSANLVTDVNKGIEYRAKHSDGLQNPNRQLARRVKGTEPGPIDMCIIKETTSIVE